MVWNRVQRVARLEEEAGRLEEEEAHLRQLPGRRLGHVIIGEINMEKSNQSKLEGLVSLARLRGWEIVAVAECGPTARRATAGSQCRHWQHEGWEMVMTNFAGVLLSPAWAAAWHAWQAPNRRSSTGRVITVALPKDPDSRPGGRKAIPAMMVSAVWAPLATSPDEELEEFWDEVAEASTMNGDSFTARSGITRSLDACSLHVVAGDWNSQVHCDEGADGGDDGARVCGPHKPSHRHFRDKYVHERIMAMEGWVHADSHRTMSGSHTRITWRNAAVRRGYELDWMVVHRRHLSRVREVKLHYQTGEVATQHSSKTYDLFVEQRSRPSGAHREAPPPVPNYRVLRGVSDAAREAREALAEEFGKRLRQATATEEGGEIDLDMVGFAMVNTAAHEAALSVCGRRPRVDRKPWLQGPRAGRLMGPLVEEAIALRERRHEWHARREARDEDELMHEQLDAGQGLQERIEIRAGLNEVQEALKENKKEQKRLSAALEGDYWSGVLHEHRNETSDSFTFFHTLENLGRRRWGEARARVNPFSVEEWREHFSAVSGEEEFMSDDIQRFIEGIPVPQSAEEDAAALDVDITDEEIDWAVRTLRCGSGGGDNLPPVVAKAIYVDDAGKAMVRRAVRQLWSSPCREWGAAGLDGPGLLVPLWKKKEPFEDKDKWRGVVLLWTAP